MFLSVFVDVLGRRPNVEEPDDILTRLKQGRRDFAGKSKNY